MCSGLVSGVTGAEPKGEWKTAGLLGRDQGHVGKGRGQGRRWGGGSGRPYNSPPLRKRRRPRRRGKWKKGQREKARGRSGHGKSRPRKEGAAAAATLKHGRHTRECGRHSTSAHTERRKQDSTGGCNAHQPILRGASRGSGGVAMVVSKQGCNLEVWRGRTGGARKG